MVNNKWVDTVNVLWKLVDSWIECLRDDVDKVFLNAHLKMSYP